MTADADYTTFLIAEENGSGREAQLTRDEMRCLLAALDTLAALRKGGGTPVSPTGDADFVCAKKRIKDVRSKLMSVYRTPSAPAGQSEVYEMQEHVDGAWQACQKDGKPLQFANYTTASNALRQYRAAVSDHRMLRLKRVQIPVPAHAAESEPVSKEPDFNVRCRNFTDLCTRNGLHSPQCDIGMDLTFCSLRCAYATNMPGARRA